MEVVYTYQGFIFCLMMMIVDEIKENILSVSQITNKGHVIIFTSSGCKIIEEDSGKAIAK